MQLWVGEHNGVSFPLFLEKKDLWQHSLHVLFPVLLSLVCFCLYVGTLLLSVFTSRTADEQWELKNYEKFRRNKVKIVWKTHKPRVTGRTWRCFGTHSDPQPEALFCCLPFFSSLFFLFLLLFISFFLSYNSWECSILLWHLPPHLLQQNQQAHMQALNSLWDVNNCHLLWLIFKNEQVLTFHGIL